MTAWVLVHSPATGPLVWQGVAARLRGQGAAVAVPDLRPSLAGSGGWAVRQAELVADSVRSPEPVEGPYVLVGHSAAGALLPSIGARLGNVHAYVFADAVLPRPGRSFAEAEPSLMEFVESKSADGVWTRPWSQWWGEGDLAGVFVDKELLDRFVTDCPPLPVAMFREPAEVVPTFPDAPCGYLRFSGAYGLDGPRALGWPTVDRPGRGDHLDMMIDPAGVARALVDLVAELTGSVSGDQLQSHE